MTITVTEARDVTDSLCDFDYANPFSTSFLPAEITSIYAFQLGSIYLCSFNIFNLTEQADTEISQLAE
jgi:hypothetical protein